MEAIPEVYGVEDSDELDESLQEDAQAAGHNVNIWGIDGDKTRSSFLIFTFFVQKAGYVKKDLVWKSYVVLDVFDQLRTRFWDGSRFSDNRVTITVHQTTQNVSNWWRN